MSSLRSRLVVASMASLVAASALFAQAAPPADGGTKPASNEQQKPDAKPAAPPTAKRTPVQLSQGAQRPANQRSGGPVLDTSSRGPVPINVSKEAPAVDESLDTTPIIRFEPEEMNFGEMQVDVPQTGKVKIVNISDKPISIARAIPSCGCTTPIWPKEPIPAGESAEMEITLKPGGRAGVPLNKTITLQIDGHAPIRLNVKGTIPEYVKIVPELMEAPGNSGRAPSESVVFTAVDGTPFKITSMTPAIGIAEDMADAAQNARTEQKVRIDWDKWAESGRVFRAQFASDHPKASSLNVMIRRPVERPAAADAGARTPRDPAATRVPPSGLVFAAQRGDLAEVTRMLESGQDANQADPGTQRTALHWAAKNGKIEIVEALLAKGASIKATDRTGRTPLALAAEGGSVESLRRLLKEGSDINARDQLNGTPIQWAAALGSPEAVQFLLDSGADPNIADGNGMTPLIWAANLGNPRNVEVLLASGKVNVEAADLLTGDTALMRACRNGKTESVTMLVGKGAKLEVRNRQGMTPFLLACQNGSLEKIKAVVAGKPELMVTDTRGWNAVDYARSRADAERDAVLTYLTTELKVPDNSGTRSGAGSVNKVDASTGTKEVPAATATGTAGKGS